MRGVFLFALSCISLAVSGLEATPVTIRAEQNTYEKDSFFVFSNARKQKLIYAREATVGIDSRGYIRSIPEHFYLLKSDLSPVKIPRKIPAQATTKIQANINFNAEAPENNSNDPTTYDKIDTYLLDSTGMRHPASIRFKRAERNIWDAYLVNESLNKTLVTARIEFNKDGSFADQILFFPYGEEPLPAISLDFSESTQFTQETGNFELRSLEQDSSYPGELQEFYLSWGAIQALYFNDFNWTSKDFGRVALATFEAPDFLKQDGNFYRATRASGRPQFSNQVD